MPEPEQAMLPLPAPSLAADQPPVPARMVNEYIYCPRLAYLMWVQGEWSDSADTTEGRVRHRRVDAGSGTFPTAADLAGNDRLHARALTLASDRLGVIAKVDAVEVDDGTVTPVDYKRGKRPHLAAGAWAPERVQLCVQGLLLKEHGYRCEQGILYFCESRERVRVPFDAELRAITLDAIHGLRLLAAAGRIPPPLDDSPKCPHCSLVGICLPDEVGFLDRGQVVPPRPLAVGRAEALPVYIQAPGARVARSGETLEITIEDAPATKARLIDISQVVLYGNVRLTTPCLHELMRREIPVTWLSHGGWFLGHTVGTGHKNVELRAAQYRASFEPAFCLRLSRELVAAKVRNARTLLRRNWRGDTPPGGALADLKRLAERARHARDLGELLGIEGAVGAAHFGHFAGTLKANGGVDAFDFTTRNRRPPNDPVNALLSFTYGCWCEPSR
jgi:CRISPR-associated protein Cas1